MKSKINAAAGLTLAVLFIGIQAVSCSVCPSITDVIILLESKNVTSNSGIRRSNAFDLHRNTILQLVHRFPMHEGKVRITVAQFNSRRSKIEVIAGKGSVSKQKKSEVLEKLQNLTPLNGVNSTDMSGNLLGAFRTVSNDIIPQLKKSSNTSGVSIQSGFSRIVLVTILSGYWQIPNLPELAAIFVRLSQQGALSYMAAYDMKDRPSRSVLPLVVSKLDFLILPQFHQAEAVAGHLTDVFQVCWKDGPCWPNNPCHYGCACVENDSSPKKYDCRSSSTFWIGNDCTKPAPYLSCLPDKIELRLPKRFVTNSSVPPQDDIVFIGDVYKWHHSATSPSKCLARIVTSIQQDKSAPPQASSMLAAEGFYYYLTASILDNECSSSYATNVANKTVIIENVVYRSRPMLPIGVRMDVPVVKLKCVYQAQSTKMQHLRLIESRSVLGKSTGTVTIPDGVMMDGPQKFPWQLQSVSRNVLTLTYEEWIKMNPYQDPDPYSEMMKRRKAEKMKHEKDLEDVKPVLRFGSGKIIQGKPKKEAPSGRIVFHAPAGCHGGPYERLDPCHPLNVQSARPTFPATTPQHTTEEATTPDATTDLITSPEPTTSEITTAEPTTEMVTMPQWTTQPDTTVSLTTPFPPTTAYGVPVGMKMYANKELTQEIGAGGAPVGSKVYVQVSPPKGAPVKPGICVYLRVCWFEANETALSQNTTATPLNYVHLPILIDGCPVDGNADAVSLSLLNNGNAAAALFAFNSVRWQGFSLDVTSYLHCNVTVCDCSQHGCAWDCSGAAHRVRRAAVNESPVLHDDNQSSLFPQESLQVNLQGEK